MKYFLFLLFFVTALSEKFSFKFINTPIYNSIPICPLHSITILQNNDLNLLNKENNDVFAIDFCPHEDIKTPNVIFKLLLGKKIQGRVRVFHFSNFTSEPLTNNLYSKKTTIFETFDRQLTNKNLKKLEAIDPYIVFIIKSWGTSFQIYNRNCRHFSNFLKKHYI